MRRFIVSLSVAAILVGMLAGGALANTGPNPYPAVSAQVCASYGGTFGGGGNSKTCEVITNTTDTFYVGFGHGINGGKTWIIDSVTDTIYAVVNGQRDTTIVYGTVSCTNPGGKDVKNTWIKPCLPSSYP